ncbi:MAG: TetR/AcrR family transcriptional regulator [Prevotellaceae bacterium]|jgi:AcrR family transcriptional regulator|nr:TetR/AcrR family transcriptional regulator [Prevotellaceae bacterium]
MRTKQKQKSDSTRNKIYEEAFRLFISKPYELVTINDLEKAIGKTRGAVFYHVKDKHDLFEKVINKYFTKSQNIYEIVGEDILEKDLTLLEFINLYLDANEKKIKELFNFAKINKDSISQKNITKIESVYLSLLSSTGYYLDYYNDEMELNFTMDRNTWTFFIQKGIENGEIKPDINAALFGEIFSSVFVGRSFQDSLTKGVNLNEIKKLFMEIYDKIKA